MKANDYYACKAGCSGISRAVQKQAERRKSLPTHLVSLQSELPHLVMVINLGDPKGSCLRHDLTYLGLWARGRHLPVYVQVPPRPEECDKGRTAAGELLVLLPRSLK